MDDDTFHRIHSTIIVEELWKCLKCGVLVCDLEQHRAVHQHLEAQSAALALVLKGTSRREDLR